MGTVHCSRECSHGSALGGCADVCRCVQAVASHQPHLASAPGITCLDMHGQSSLVRYPLVFSADRLSRDSRWFGMSDRHRRCGQDREAVRPRLVHGAAALLLRHGVCCVRVCVCVCGGGGGCVCASCKRRGSPSPVSVSVSVLSALSAFVYASVQTVCTLSGHTKKITDVVLHPVMDAVISASQDSTVRVWANQGASAGVSSPLLFSPHSCFHLSYPILTSPLLFSPPYPVLTSPLLFSPLLSCSHLSSPVLTSPLLFSPLLSAAAPAALTR